MKCCRDVHFSVMMSVCCGPFALGIYMARLSSMLSFDDEEPATDAEEPVTDDEEPATDDEEPATDDKL